MTNLDELERMAKRYAQLKNGGNDAELAQLASSIVEAISLPSFSFPLKEETLSSDGTTTYVYEDNATFPALYDFLGQVKNEGLAPFITAYGFYPTISHESILDDCTAIDSVVIGEPEMPFAALAESGLRDEHVSRVPGIALRNGSGHRVNRPEPVIDIDSLPFPVRTEALLRLPEVNLLGSRGCYGRCTFCYINSFYG